MTQITPQNCWIVVEKGLIGTLNQCIGVAKALNVPYEIKEISIKQPWKTFAPFLKFGTHHSFSNDSAKLEPPWPDLVIGAGRKAIAPNLMIKQKSENKSLCVQLLDPRISPDHFDLVALPKHDPTRGENVITTIGAPNAITQQKLSDAISELETSFAEIVTPRITVLIGGSTKNHKMSPDFTIKLAHDLKKIAMEKKASLLITTSRRTGKDNEKILKEALQGTNSVIWDGKTPNPYFAYLGTADYIMVTSDSVSMISEAASTGKPVYIYKMENHVKRVENFLENITQIDAARFYNGVLDETWIPHPLNDAKIVADAILKAYAAR